MTAEFRQALAVAVLGGLLLGVLLALMMPVPAERVPAAGEDLSPGELAALQEEARGIAREAADGTG